MAGGWLTTGLFLCCLVVAFALFVRYLYWRVEQGLQQMARLEQDPAARAEVLRELDSEIARSSSDPALRLKRANLRRYDENYAGVAEDLRAYLETQPNDDAGWAELADALLLMDQAHDALQAVNRALELDPAYIDYYPMKVHAALACHQPETAAEAVQSWREQWLQWRTQKQTGGRGWMFRTYDPAKLPEMDPYVELHAAAVALARHDQTALSSALQAVNLQQEGIRREDLEAVPVLRPLLETDEVRAQLDAPAKNETGEE